MRFRRFCRCIPVCTALVAVLSGCSSVTDVDGLTISLRPLSFLTPEEWGQWPSTPTVAGGEVLVVRGTAFVGCGAPAARVQRRQHVVGVEIRAVDTDRVCLAHVAAWVPFEATVIGLAPGSYRVRVGVVGRDERTEGTATIVGSQR
jgi:hypothetical protein